MNPDKKHKHPIAGHGRPWAWIPSLYIAEGLPYVLVMTVSTIMYTRLGASLTDIGFWTSLLGFAWVIKPLWGPLVDLYWTKRRWTILMQLLMGVLLGVVALTLRTDWWWSASLLALGTVALFSATHDIAADGFYMDALDEKQQSFYVGIRSTFYRIAMIFGQGVLLIIAGMIEQRTGPQSSEVVISAAPPGFVMEAPKNQPEQGFVKFEPTLARLDAGSSTTVMVTLAKQTDSTRTVTLKRQEGSFLKELFPYGAERQVDLTDKKNEVLKFNRENWNIPQEVAFKADGNMKEGINVSFKAASGNIPLTWALCFGGVGMLLLGFGFYHMVALPKPWGDGATEPVRTPFIFALGVMALVVAVPVILYTALYYLFYDGLYGLAAKYPQYVSVSVENLPALGVAIIGGFILLLVLIGYFFSGGAIGLRERWIHKRKEFVGDAISIAIIAAAACYVGYNVVLYGIHWLQYYALKLAEWLTGKPFNISDALLKLFNIGLVVLFVYLLFQLRSVQKAAKGAFSSAARVSHVPFDEVFASFFSKPGVGRMVAFLLLYRLGEALLVKMSGPFLIKPMAEGGMGLSSAQYGLAYGTFGILALTLGGILGGLVASRYGLKRWILPMCFAINLPDLLYVYLAYVQPPEFWKVVACVAGESFGYGFGFTAYMLYMLYIAGSGEHKTSHFALCTGFMALGMMLPGMLSGDIADTLTKSYAEAPNIGWTWFFIIVCIATIPGFLMLGIIPLDKEFGRRSEDTGVPEKTDETAGRERVE